MVEDRGDAAQELALDHALEVLEEGGGLDPDLGGGAVVGPVADLHRALERADHGDVALVVGLRLELARDRRLGGGGERLGALLHLEVHVDLEQASGSGAGGSTRRRSARWRTSSVPWSPSSESGGVAIVNQRLNSCVRR